MVLRGCMNHCWCSPHLPQLHRSWVPLLYRWVLREICNQLHNHLLLLLWVRPLCCCMWWHLLLCCRPYCHLHPSPQLLWALRMLLLFMSLPLLILLIYPVLHRIRHMRSFPQPARLPTISAAPSVTANTFFNLIIFLISLLCPYSFLEHQPCKIALWYGWCCITIFSENCYMCRLSLEPVFANIVLLGHIILCLCPGKELARLLFFSLNYNKWHK